MLKIKHFFTGHVKIDDTNIIQLLNMSKKISSRAIEDCCSNYLIEKISLNTVCFFYYISKLHKARKLKLATKRYIERCFEYVIRTTEFLDLKYEHLKSILKSSKLNITTELSVLNAIDVWVKHRIDERSTFIMDLLPKVRLQLLPIVTLNELKLSRDYF